MLTSKSYKTKEISHNEAEI
jgi:hypothetical protein